MIGTSSLWTSSMSGPCRLLLRREVSGFHSGGVTWAADGATRHEICTVARRKE